jgi:uncharacterized membrane protein
MTQPDESPRANTEHAISVILRIGVGASLLLITAGTLLSFLRGGYGTGRSELGRLTGNGGAFPRTVSWFTDGIRHLDGQAVIVAGLLLLIATPVLRVAVSIAVFAKEKDRTYVLICSAVLLLLLISFAIGRSG